jgi:hypothetical protein
MNKKTSTILKAYSYFGGNAEVEIHEKGWGLLSDTREVKDGYLHIFDGSAEEITDACRDMMIRYFFRHGSDMPGLGATPQQRYFSALSIEDIQIIGNEGCKAYYA